MRVSLLVESKGYTCAPLTTRDEALVDLLLRGISAVLGPNLVSFRIVNVLFVGGAGDAEIFVVPLVAVVWQALACGPPSVGPEAVVYASALCGSE